jgi:small multidrug resistance family-3 protein
MAEDWTCPGASATIRASQMPIAKTLGLFVATAFAEILGCYLSYLWIRGRGSAWLLIPAALSLAAFAWLLALHPNPAGRTYAAYGGVYIATSVAWLWFVEHRVPDRWDVIGAIVAVTGTLIIAFGPRSG